MSHDLARIYKKTQTTRVRPPHLKIPSIVNPHVTPMLHQENLDIATNPVHRGKHKSEIHQISQVKIKTYNEGKNVTTRKES